MADNKKSFLLYCDLINIVKKLPKETQADLFMTILQYVNDENPDPTDLLLQIAFEPIKLQLKRDLKQWEENAPKRVESGRNGGIKSGETRRLKAELKKQNEANEANPSKPKQNEANEGVTVTVPVTETVIINKVFEDLKFELLNSDRWIEDNARILKLTVLSVKEYLSTFIDEIYLKDDYYKDLFKIKSHFVSWLKKKLENKIGFNKTDQPIKASVPKPFPKDHPMPDYSNRVKDGN